MKYHALKKKAFLAAAVFTGTIMVIPSMCLAASDKDIQTYTDTDFAMDTVVSETLYTTGDDINSKLTSVLTDVETNLPDAYALLLAKLLTIEAEIAALDERMSEIEDELHEAWLGGTE